MAYVKGYGTTLAWDSAGGTSWTTIPQAVNVTPPQTEMGSVEVTHLTSTMREYLPTIVNPQELSFTLEYDPANAVHAALIAAGAAGTIANWKVTLSDSGGCTIIALGFIKMYGVGELNVDVPATINMTVQITGNVVVTP